MEEKPLPHEKVVFVCTNRREPGERVCCAERGSVELHARLKELVKERGHRVRIRVSKSGCMDRCEDGPNVMIFPDNVWLCGVEERDLEAILDRLVADVERGGEPSQAE
jgi:(2Fe-2S) ferredoxin